MRRHRWLAAGCFALAGGLALNSLLGPLAFGVIEYRYTEPFANQGIGLDAFALAIVVPLLACAGVLVLGQKLAGPVLALGPALMAAYMLPQYVLGGHYRDLTGNNEDFFLLHLCLFILSAGIAILAWDIVDERALPAVSERNRFWTGMLLFAIALFLVLRYLPGLVAIWRDEPGVEYVSDPVAFWLIAFMDLGMVLPVAVAGALALLRGLAAAQKLMYAVIGWFALVGPAVAAMALAMLLNDDPHASTGAVISFAAFALAFAVAALLIFRPLFRIGARFPASHDNGPE